MELGAVKVGDEVGILDGGLVIARGLVVNLTEDRELLSLVLTFGSARSSNKYRFSARDWTFRRADGWQVRVLPISPE